MVIPLSISEENMNDEILRSTSKEYSSIIESFPGYEFKQFEDGSWHNMFRGTDVGRGGYVYAEPGMYYNVALLDVGNMHGASIIALNKFGEHTKNFKELRDARMAIKAHDFDKARKMLNGKLAKYLTDENEADALQLAIKLILNSTYGIAAATFPNPLADPRDRNNIIALRGALFMRTLQDEVVKKGYRAIHIKTDSIKIPNATPELINWVIEFGEKYGYEFEHECTYDRICLVNDAVYIAKYDDKGIRNKNGKHPNEWTATGTQFQQPFVFKELFSKEPIIFKDMCEVKSISRGDGLYLDMNEDLPEEIHNYKFVGRVGEFCPIIPGAGGGELMRKSGEKYSSAAGTKGFRWLESQVVKTLGMEDKIDISYYRRLCDAAIENISKYGDFEEFVNGPSKSFSIPYDFMNIPEDADEEKGMPFDAA